jgi:hypothetical protein
MDRFYQDRIGFLDIEMELDEKIEFDFGQSI